MGQALYRKYRSKSLSEIVGQEHITETLDKAIKSGRISHAYLFTGPRGVGKTSIARILAHQVNDLPYEDDSMHIDIIEIDAASNRRIDEIRELRDKVAIAPTSAKYKVYIIDEVHMLTKEAFNALLKTLEEPPAHVIFILATTDAHKLPSTIVSRTQRYTFKSVGPRQVQDHLRLIADSEHISADDDALALLAAHGEGSFRDSISMLDQASGHNENLTLAFVQTLLGIPPVAGIQDVVTALQAHNPSATVQSLSKLYDGGFQPSAIAKVLAKTLRTELINGTPALAGIQLLDLLAKLLEVPVSHDPERLLEIILLECAGAGSLEASKIVPSVISAPKAEAKKQRKISPPPVEPEIAPKSQPADLSPKDQAQAEELPVAPPSGTVDDALWPEALQALKQKYNTLYGVVRMAVPTFEGNHLELAFAFAFHQKRLSDPKNKKILADIIFNLSGQGVQITCVVKKEPAGAAANSPANKPAAPDLGAITDIFGGAEII